MMNYLKYALLTCAVLFAACGDDSSTSASDTPNNSVKTLPTKFTDVAANYLNPDYSYGEMTDARDGHVYKTTTIGSQTWLAQNLNYETANSVCFNNAADSCAKYGRLYSWNDAKDACPSGWHLPDTTEWITLFTEVGGSSTAGRILKSQSGWKYDCNGTDAYGFSALPAGSRGNVGYFNCYGTNADFWSATEHSSDKAYDMYLNVIRPYAAALFDRAKLAASSVRCLKD